MTNAFTELRWRDLIYDSTEYVEAVLGAQKITVYNGFDPTGASLHIGNLVPLMSLARLQRFGHTPIAIAGGGTGMIGDPSGTSAERNLLTPAQVEANLVSIRQQLAGVLDFEVQSNPARIINNAEWLSEQALLDFLREVGKYFTVNYMLAKDSVRSRLEREDGISFTEFSYMLLQAYDFLYLFENHGCLMQTGGSDQWGNILAGIELIRRKLGQKAHGLVYPLITRADGSKFGKTAEGTSVWLDPGRTSPYRFYQFWLNSDDGDVINYLKYFTWLTHGEVAELERALLERPEERLAQRRLAQAVTGMIHGQTALAQAEQASQVLFGGDLDGVAAADIAEIFADVPSSTLNKSELEGEGISLVDLLLASKLATSKGDARRAIDGGGIYLNNRRVTERGASVTLAGTIEAQFILLRKGRKRYHLVQLVG